MLLSITTTHRPATQLGYLLHKNPARVHEFSLSFGKAHVVYPEANEERCTAALLLDVDPVGLVRKGRGTTGPGSALDQYVNDRPYTASSFLSVAIAQVFGTALSGRSKHAPELAEAKIPLEAKLNVLPCRGGEAFLRKLFEPLGYEVTASRHTLDAQFPEWGESPYYSVSLAGAQRLKDLLDHLYVLVPVLDDDKHYWVDGGKLVVAHAGMKEEYQGRSSGRVRDFALYGETTGETDEFGLPVRCNWASEYRGRALVVYGHTPVLEPEWLNHTINIDTGCVFGGKLTALRYPEKELVSVPAERVYCEPAKPLAPAVSQDAALTAQQAHDDLLDFEDVSGKRIISTRLHLNVTVREENAAAALEAMSRFAVSPKGLVYLPPTMSPCETSQREGLLEHPAEAFAYFRGQGLEEVICEEKHMGSRAVLIVCRDPEAARKRFGVATDSIGVCTTRTGRSFFNDASLEENLLSTVRGAMERCGLWDELKTDWACLDCELMPWSAKAQELLRSQYAAVGSAAKASFAAAADLLDAAARLNPEATPLRDRVQMRGQLARQFVDAYRRYSWNVTTPSDLKLAPFHLLATEGAIHVEKCHVWHMETIARLCSAAAETSGDDSPTLIATPYLVVRPGDEASEARGIAWWEELTSRGGEGMVVKPVQFAARGPRGLVQPAVKCRGREYLRIIYGPEYTLPENLERLRHRGLSAKRSLALREFALGVEALERFVRREPLRRVHECVFAVLALESEPVDPRL